MKEASKEVGDGIRETDLRVGAEACTSVVFTTLL